MQDTCIYLQIHKDRYLIELGKIITQFQLVESSTSENHEVNNSWRIETQGRVCYQVLQNLNYLKYALTVLKLIPGSRYY